MKPAEVLLAFVQQARAQAPKLQIIGSKDLPDLPHALKLPDNKNNRGIGIKITYELQGKPVEEEFYAVYYSLEIPYDGPQGRTWQINWGLNAMHSFRAAAPRDRHGPGNRSRDREGTGPRAAMNRARAPRAERTLPSWFRSGFVPWS